MALTKEVCKNSIIIPILFWEWFGYPEWMEIDTFIKEFADDFEFAYDVIKINSKKNKRIQNQNEEFKNMLPHEIVSFILKVLLSQRQYILGIYVIYKK